MSMACRTLPLGAGLGRAWEAVLQGAPFKCHLDVVRILLLLAGAGQCARRERVAHNMQNRYPQTGQGPNFSNLDRSNSITL
jgi:hypothetical protein